MIKNFDVIKNQLQELSQIINSFKSEAVQLRIIELIFGASVPEDKEKGEETDKEEQKKKIRKKKKSSPTTTESKTVTKPLGKGAVATLIKLSEGDFFNTAKTIKDIIHHCEVNLAKKIKQTEISGKLARMVREGELKRSKNTDGQYEYKKA